MVHGAEMLFNELVSTVRNKYQHKKAEFKALQISRLPQRFAQRFAPEKNV
jgi:hypothetical protein